MKRASHLLTFFGLDLFRSHPLDFVNEHNLRLGRAVDAACLDTDQDSTTILQECMGIQAHNTSLIGLGNVGEDDIDHRNEKSAGCQRVRGAEKT